MQTLPTFARGATFLKAPFIGDAWFDGSTFTDTADYFGAIASA